VGQIYIAYRRDDSAAISGRVADRLRMLFGERSVMKDVTFEGTGNDMARRVADSMRQCSAMLVVIGPSWLSGELADQFNQTYDEVVTALGYGMPVIPALVHGAALPDWRLLPQPLQSLVAQGAVVLGSEATFDRDMEILGETLRRFGPPVGYQPIAPAASKRAPALPGEAGAQARRASLGRRVLLTALVFAVLIASCGGGSLLLARHFAVANALSFARGTQLRDIASPPGTDDAWAVGGDDRSCILLHYTGRVWSRAACPFGAELDSISFVNSGEGWAVGGDYETCRLLHYHDGSWSPITCPVSGIDMPVVRMDTRGGGWIVGDNDGKSVLRYAQGAWSVYSGVIGLGGLRTLAVSGQGDAWATGYDGFHEASGGAWVSVQTPLLDRGAFIEDMDFSRADGAGWAVGYTGLLQRAYIAHYQQGQWQPFTPLPSVGNLTLVRSGLFGDVWAAGGAQSHNALRDGGLILRYDGRTWVTLGDPIQGAIHGITDMADGDAWAVGDNYTSDDDFQPALLWYHSGYWRIYHT
jgi:hypothetical protein